jgi:hypothetical protein
MRPQALAQLLIELVDIDPATGVMNWKPRSPQHFNSGRRGKQAACDGWNKRFSGRIAFNTPHSDGIKCSRFLGNTLIAPVGAWCLYYKSWPDGEVRHKNGNSNDNSRDNLYVTSHMETSWDQKIASNNTSGVKGVSWHRRRGAWQARIIVDGKTHHLGYFNVLGAAKEARLDAEHRLYVSK